MAARFWVGDTGTWDAADTTHWSATSGGAGGQSVPGSGDTVTIDAASGTGTITVNTNVAVTSIVCGAMNMVLDFSANNNTVTLTGGFNGTGTGTRTIRLGTGVWTITFGAIAWQMATITNLTFDAVGSTLVFSGTNSSERTITFGALAGAPATGGGGYNIVTFAANTGGGDITITGAATIATLNIAAPNYIKPTSGTTLTVTNALNVVGTSSTPIGFASSTTSTAATIACAAGGTFDWCVFRDMTFSGGTFTATNSLSLGENTISSLTPPTSGGGGARVIGG